MSAPRQAPCWLSVTEAGHYLHCRPEDLRQAIAAGKLPAYRKGPKGVIVHTDDLDAFVRETYEPAMCVNAARRVLAGAR